MGVGQLPMSVLDEVLSCPLVRRYFGTIREGVVLYGALAPRTKRTCTRHGRDQDKTPSRPEALPSGIQRSAVRWREKGAS